MNPFDAISAVSATLRLSKTARDALESIKNADILNWVQDLRQYILDLREEKLALKDESLILQEKIKQLEAKQKVDRNMKSDGIHYWDHRNDNEKDGPFCQPCYDQGQTMRLIRQSGYYYCQVCNRAYGHYEGNSEYY